MKILKFKYDNDDNITFLTSNDIFIKKGNYLIINDGENLKSGIAISGVYDEIDDNVIDSKASIVRVANSSDLTIIEKNKIDALRALDFAKKQSNNLKLNMQFVDSYYTFDKKQLFLIYTADDRIDFRELAKRIAQKYKTRIELRQIGVRDKAKKIGGLGPCGLLLCCSSFLNTFNSVSINMAKNQNLALNPSKINGMCGRLLCCLSYEDEFYSEIKKLYPKINQKIIYTEKVGKVSSINALNNTFTIILSDNSILDVKLGDNYEIIE